MFQRRPALRTLATTIALTLAGGVLVVFVAAILASQILASAVFAPAWSVLTGIGAAFTGTRAAPVDVATGSDLAWAWQMHAGLLVVGVVVGAAWGALVLRSADDRSIRIARRVLGTLAWITLAVGMLLYGLAKVIPAQMGYMNLPAYQLQAIGDTEPFSMLWGYMAASTPYTVITGLIETTAGVLLLFPRTRTAGALLSVVALTQIVLLNVFYDVPVKLLAFELLVIALVLTAPQWRALLRTVFPDSDGAPPRRRWATAGTAAALAAFTVLAVLTVTQNVARVDRMNTPRDARDGVWRAISLVVDGRPALAAGDEGPVWTSVAITLRGTADRPATGSAQDSLVTQTPDGAVTAWGLRATGDRFTVRAGAGAEPVDLTVSLPSPDTLRLSGTVDGRRIEARYERRGMERRATIRLVQSPFDRTRPRL